MFFESGKLFLCTSVRILTIDPLTCHLTVSTQLYCRPLFTCMDGFVRGSQVPRCLFSVDFLSFPFSFLSCVRSQFHTIKCGCDNFCLIIECTFWFLPLIQSSLPAQSVAILSQTFPRLCHAHLCFHLEWSQGSSLIPFACVDCHHFVLLHL